jgi:Flp pilus assembly protein TadG
MRHQRNRNNRNEGQAVVEFALVITLLLVIVLGIFEFGRLWMTMNVLSGAAREGARIAAVTGPSPAQVRNAVQNVLDAANIEGATVTIAGPNGNNEVTVTVQIDYATVTGNFVPGLAANMQLSRSAVMHWEG